MRTEVQAARGPSAHQDPLVRLQRAFDAAAFGESRVALIAGRAGSGKSALVRELRPCVQAQGGRFVACNYDRRNEREATAVMQALGALGRMLLAESGEDERAQVRSRILRTLGPHAGLARVVPEFAVLLHDVPDADAVDPAHAAARMAEVVAGLLRVIASPTAPLVLVLDDLQWGGTLSTRLLDAILAATDLSGLLLVGAYNDDALPPGHPLITAMARWKEAGTGPDFIAVPDPASLTTLHARSSDPAGSAPDAAGAGLRARIRQLPADAHTVLRVLACIGSRVRRDAVRTAAALDEPGLDAALHALQDAGLVLNEPEGDGMLCLSDGQVQLAAEAGMHDGRREDFHLDLARRLAAHPGFASLAADQYALAARKVADPDESARAATFLRGAAREARLIGNHVAAWRMQESALLLLERAALAGAASASAVAECEVEFHLSLYSIGRLAEADAMYARIAQRHARPLDYIDAACAQVTSLTNRDRMDEAITLGVRVLGDLGLSPPPLDTGPLADFDARFERLRAWVDAFDLSREAARPETQEPHVVAAAKMIYRLQSPAAFKNIHLLAWLVFESQELWEVHGACAPLSMNFIQANFMTIVHRQDWRTGYLAARQALDLCEVRRWDMQVAHARSGSIYWFEPLERSLAEAERAREALLAYGNLRNASFCYRHSAICIFDCGPTLQRFAEEVDGALALSHRADNRQAIARCLADRELLHALTLAGAYPGEPGGGGGMPDPADEASRGWIVSYQACARAIASAIFGDADALARHARVAMDMRASFLGLYPTVWVHWLAGLSAACGLQRHRAAARPPAEGALQELDTCIEWLDQRASGAPFNFRHLHMHLLAERAWAVGELAAAALHFDEALDALEQTCRPWHQALLLERSARLHGELRWAHSGAQLLREAQRIYAAWGATAVVESLGRQTGLSAQAVQLTLPGPVERGPSSPDEQDMVAVLRASQALSSERSPAKLRAKVENVLGSMTAATRVVLAVRIDDQWEIPSCAPAPLTAFRYAERTRETIVLEDALADERFSADPYFGGMQFCSLMVLPIFRSDEMHGMLILANTMARGVFNDLRHDAVLMVAGQLAVSLEIAQMYDGLERKVQQQTGELARAQAGLVEEAHRSGMAQIATNVLHNVGNVLTSVNVSAHVLGALVRKSRGARVGDIARLLQDHMADIGRFFREDARGPMLPHYVRDLAKALSDERLDWLTELGRLRTSVDHIKNVVKLQQAFAVSKGSRDDTQS